MTGHQKEVELPTLLVMGRADQLRRADRDGWARNWPYGAPHYFQRGRAYALCGSGASHGYPLDVQDEPDGNRPARERKSACPHCTKLLKAGKAGHSR